MLPLAKSAQGGAWGGWVWSEMWEVWFRGLGVGRRVGFDSGWWQLKYFFIFIPNPGEMIQFDEYFSNGLKPPTSDGFRFGDRKIHHEKVWWMVWGMVFGKILQIEVRVGWCYAITCGFFCFHPWDVTPTAGTNQVPDKGSTRSVMAKKNCCKMILKKSQCWGFFIPIVFPLGDKLINSKNWGFVYSTAPWPRPHLSRPTQYWTQIACPLQQYIQYCVTKKRRTYAVCHSKIYAYLLLYTYYEYV